MATEAYEKLAAVVRKALVEWHPIRDANSLTNILEAALRELDAALLDKRKDLYRDNARGGFNHVYSDDIIVPPDTPVEFGHHDNEPGAWVQAQLWVQASSAGDDDA